MVCSFVRILPDRNVSGYGSAVRQIAESHGIDAGTALRRLHELLELGLWEARRFRVNTATKSCVAMHYRPMPGAKPKGGVTRLDRQSKAVDKIPKNPKTIS